MSRLTERITGTFELKGAIDVPCSEVCERNIACETCLIQKAFNKLAHYEDLEEQGLLLKLPCKVGDTVWSIHKGINSGEWHICDMYDYRVTDILLNENREPLFRVSNMYGTRKLSDLGKTWFLTKAEAEKELAEMEK